MQKIKHLIRSIVQKLRVTTPSAIIIAAIILAGSHLAYGVIISGKSSSSSVTLFKGRAIDSTDLLTGNIKSKVVVVEYSDPECPFCAQLHPTINKLEEEYSSKISFAYRYFPLTQIHSHAFEESRAIHCVGKVSGAAKRAEYIDVMFAYKFNNQNMLLPTGMKETFAKNLAVDQTAFASCMKDAESSDAITTSLQDGVTAGVQGTPATFVLYKGKKGYEVVSLVDGARPYEYFKAVIDEALAR